MCEEVYLTLIFLPKNTEIPSDVYCILPVPQCMLLLVSRVCSRVWRLLIRVINIVPFTRNYRLRSPDLSLPICRYRVLLLKSHFQTVWENDLLFLQKVYLSRLKGDSNYWVWFDWIESRRFFPKKNCYFMLKFVKVNNLSCHRLQEKCFTLQYKADIG